jgi:hypothetical protein
MRDYEMNPGTLAAAGAQEVNEADVASENSKRRWHAQARWHDQNPIAGWAHSATRSAIRKGLIARQPCGVCGAEPADAHHADHRRPLDVQWLCRRHHRQHHAAQRRGKP